MNTEDTLKNQQNVITQLNQRVSTLEYILTQTMALIFQNTSSADTLLLEMQETFANKISNNGTISTADNEGFKSAERIFTSVRACLPERDDTNIQKQ